MTAPVLAPAAQFVTYLWHYMLARLLYDELVGRILHDRAPAWWLVALVAACVLVLARGRRRRRRT
jgi:hypothetical protein